MWLPTDDEVRGITEPLSRIAARHTPLVAGEETSDVLDGLEAGVVAAGYVTRAAMQTRQIRAERIAAEANGQVYYHDAGGA